MSARDRDTNSNSSLRLSDPSLNSILTDEGCGPHRYNSILLVDVFFPVYTTHRNAVSTDIKLFAELRTTIRMPPRRKSYSLLCSYKQAVRVGSRCQSNGYRPDG